VIRSALIVLLLAACSGGVPQCRVGADCASGVCNSDGTCGTSGSGGGAAGGGSASTGGGSSSGGGSAAQGGGTAMGGGSGGGNVDSGTPDGGIGPSCLPNHDGTITRAEVPLQSGLHATFRVATNATLSTAPTTADGGNTWDLTGALSGDHSVLVETMPLAGQWFANDFAGATYATKLSDSSDLLGVFEVTDDALLLRGVVSPMSSLTQTELTYSPPAKLLSFPLTDGATWTTTSTVSGTLNGSIWTQTEQYDSKVSKRGTALTPFSSFDVLRVQTVLTRTVGLVVTTTNNDQFVTECFGVVATMTSQADETQTDWSDNAEVRRLAP
jgi:hypothetical protein